MKVRFTKMQGAGNDFVVLDATRTPLNLTTEQFRHLGDRHFGVGADQILIVEPAPRAGVDFGYRIVNNSGDEVEHCGNGARCFVRFVREKGLTAKRQVVVQTVNRVLELNWQDDGQVTVDMGVPRFEHDQLPFLSAGLVPTLVNGFDLWPLVTRSAATVQVAVLSMGNPHAVLCVDDAAKANVAGIGPEVELLPNFPAKVNVGFMEVVSRETIRLRVFERNAGETLACGTGACAAVVAGIRLGLLGPRVEVFTHGGVLSIEWAGMGQPVRMTGPTQTVFEGEIDL